MRKHPYPAAIVESVADELASMFFDHYEIGSFDEMSKFDQDMYRRNADWVLKALWEASRVEGPRKLHDLPPDAAIVGVNGRADTVGKLIGYTFRSDFPAHVIYWGSDESGS